MQKKIKDQGEKLIQILIFYKLPSSSMLYEEAGM